jgi:hypothetical protein
MGIRTPDLQLAKLPLYQLSYAPVGKRSRVEIGVTNELMITPLASIFRRSAKTELCATVSNFQASSPFDFEGLTACFQPKPEV